MSTQLKMLLRYGAVLLVSLNVSACASSNTKSPMRALFARMLPSAETERSHFAAPFHYLRLTVNERVVFLASGNDSNQANAVVTWFSGSHEVVRMQNGRLISAIGTPTEWRAVTLPALPSWSQLAQSNQPFTWSRVRDVMPGYHYALQDHLELKRIPPPSNSQLKVLNAQSLIWFEEAMLNPLENDAESFLPVSRYAVDLIGESAIVRYAEQCLSRELCFTWQQWPVAAKGAL